MLLPLCNGKLDTCLINILLAILIKLALVLCYNLAKRLELVYT